MNMVAIKRVVSRPLPWQAGRLLFAVSRKGNFLGRAGWVLKFAPKTRRQFWALRLLSLSPHYFIYQWSDRYRGMTREAVLHAESARMRASRQVICDRLLMPYLRRDMTVVDFGCGPGYLAKSVSRHVTKVLAVDISEGVLACASYINAASNVEYVANRSGDLRIIDDSSVDFLYSMAVIQHLERDVACLFLREFRRILKPGSAVLCHLILGDHAVPPRWRYWVGAPVVKYTADEIEMMARAAGFPEVQILPARELAEIDDDIGDESVVVLR